VGGVVERRLQVEVGDGPARDGRQVQGHARVQPLGLGAEIGERDRV
jgi:hypothetical protein